VYLKTSTAEAVRSFFPFVPPTISLVVSLLSESSKFSGSGPSMVILYKTMCAILKCL